MHPLCEMDEIVIKYIIHEYIPSKFPGYSMRYHTDFRTIHFVIAGNNTTHSAHYAKSDLELGYHRLCTFLDTAIQHMMTT